MARPKQAQPEADEIVKVDGRSKAARAARAQQQPIDEPSVAPMTRARPNPPRPPARAATREHPREVDRQPSRRGATVVEGRGGEALSRRQAIKGDVFFVPDAEIPDGWDYQWNTVSVSGSPDAAKEIQLEMHANGWRPVPAERHPGRWTAPGESGAIIVKGLRLEERPSALGEEARTEDKARARAQMRDQTDSLRLTKKMPDGFESGRGKYRGTGADVRMSVDPGLDIPQPSHEIED